MEKGQGGGKEKRKHWQGCGEIEALVCSGGKVKWCHQLEIVISLIEKSNTNCQWSRASTPDYLSRTNGNMCPPKDWYAHIQNSIAHNRENPKTCLVSIHWWMNKQDAVQPLSTILSAITWNYWYTLPHGWTQRQEATCKWRETRG